jgi:hypothetical protein
MLFQALTVGWKLLPTFCQFSQLRLSVLLTVDSVASGPGFPGQMIWKW